MAVWSQRAVGHLTHAPFCLTPDTSRDLLGTTRASTRTRKECGGPGLIPGLEGRAASEGPAEELCRMGCELGVHHPDHEHPTFLLSLVPHAMVRTIIKAHDGTVLKRSTLARDLQERTGTAREPEGHVDRSIAASVVDAHSTPR